MVMARWSHTRSTSPVAGMVAPADAKVILVAFGVSLVNHGELRKMIICFLFGFIEECLKLILNSKQKSRESHLFVMIFERKTELINSNREQSNEK